MIKTLILDEFYDAEIKTRDFGRESEATESRIQGLIKSIYTNLKMSIIRIKKLEW
jgi:hypothetical protein